MLEYSAQAGYTCWAPIEIGDAIVIGEIENGYGETESSAGPSSDVRLRVARALGDMSDLKALPQVVRRALRCLSDSRSSSAELAAILSTDQAIAGRLLGAANSVLFRGSRRFVTVQEAVVRLGYLNVRRLLLVAGLSDAFQRPLRLYNMAPGELWIHSLAAAVAARLIAASSGLVNAESAYIGGLLHDIGRAAMARDLGRSAVETMTDITRSGDISFHQAERQVLGFTHADVGAVLLDEWGLGDELVAAVGAHHDGVVPAGPLAWVIHVGDVLAVTAVPPSSSVGWIWSVDPGVVKRLGLEQWLDGGAAGDLDDLLKEVRRGVTIATRLIDQGLG